MKPSVFSALLVCAIAFAAVQASARFSCEQVFSHESAVQISSSVVQARLRESSVDLSLISVAALTPDAWIGQSGANRAALAKLLREHVRSVVSSQDADWPEVDPSEDLPFKNRMAGTVDEFLRLVQIENELLQGKLSDWTWPKILQVHERIFPNGHPILLGDFTGAPRAISGPLSDLKTASHPGLAEIAGYRRAMQATGLLTPEGETTLNFIFHVQMIQAGLVPPRVTADELADTATAQGAWIGLLQRRQAHVIDLQNDWQDRYLHGLAPELSPYLLVLDFSGKIDIDFRRAGRVTTEKSGRKAKVDLRQFRTWLSYKLASDPTLTAGLKKNPVETWRALESDFENFELQTRMDYEHAREGLQEISLNFVDEDFRSRFNDQSAKNADQWNQKMDDWYRRTLLWRGHGYSSRILSDDEVLDIFRHEFDQLLCNEGLIESHKGMKRSQWPKFINNEFDRYNDALFNGKVSIMAKDQSEEGRLYKKSYAMSTSKRRVIARGFAMGAGKVAAIGQQGSHQDELADRILFGFYRANKDVDLGRLKQIEPAFSYKYGRQAEVMGIGAIDPDAVMVVQKIAADGSTIVSYVRNPKAPDQVWIVNGEFDGTAGRPDKSDLIRTVQLWP